jgi:DNA-binding GntR family transcriptional regulator
MATSVNTLTRFSLAAVRREVERIIAVGEFKGGDRINESALALRQGVSRAPIRVLPTQFSHFRFRHEPERGSHR